MSEQVKIEKMSISELCQRAGVRPSGTYDNGAMNYGARGTKLCDYLEANGVTFKRSPSTKSNPKGARKFAYIDESAEKLLKNYADTINNEKNIENECGAKANSTSQKLDVIIGLLSDLLTVWKK